MFSDHNHTTDVFGGPAPLLGFGGLLLALRLTGGHRV
jgi:hypothetical protein